METGGSGGSNKQVKPPTATSSYSVTVSDQDDQPEILCDQETTRNL